MGRRQREARAVELAGIVRNRLKVLRAERDWSQAELGGRLGVSRQAVNAIETGKYDPSLPLAFRLARLFGVPIEEIFDDGFEGQGDAR
jgi:putative transcriptional regulator